jgi:multicomponent Na+:H+ antiporter subunit D
LAVGLLTLYSMIKIWNEAFWKDAPTGDLQMDRRVPLWMIVPAVVLALMTVGIGIFPSILLDVSSKAAEQLLDPSAYREAVLQINPQAPGEP